MRLLKLDITNFQGIKWLSLDPGGFNISVFGDYGTG